jgi:hypothetical protein
MAWALPVRHAARRAFRPGRHARAAGRLRARIDIRNGAQGGAVVQLRPAARLSRVAVGGADQLVENARLVEGMAGAIHQMERRLGPGLVQRQANCTGHGMS